jgi:hypothetical protein
MKKIKTFFFFSIVLLSCEEPSQNLSNNKDENQTNKIDIIGIKKIFKTYVDDLHKGNINGIKQIFHPNLRVVYNYSNPNALQPKNYNEYINLLQSDVIYKPNEEVLAMEVKEDSVIAILRNNDLVTQNLKYTPPSIRHIFVFREGKISEIIIDTIAGYSKDIKLGYVQLDKFDKWVRKKYGEKDMSDTEFIQKLEEYDKEVLFK